MHRVCVVTILQSGRAKGAIQQKLLCDEINAEDLVQFWKQRHWTYAGLKEPFRLKHRDFHSEEPEYMRIRVLIEMLVKEDQKQ